VSDNPISKAFAVNPAGKVVSQTPEQVAASGRGRGYTPVSEETAKGLAKGAEDLKYVDENWGTAGQAAMGVADGATLGMGPALATKLGILDRGHLEAAQQSGAYTAGEVGGFLLPALATGGEGVVAKALARTPAGMLGEAGTLAERAVARLLPEAGLMGKAGTSAVRMAARGATEGALMNVAHEGSHEIITNQPLSAQALLASGLDGALFGGLAGGVLGGVSSLAGSTADALGNRGLSASVRGGERQAGLALKRVGQSPADFAATEGGTVGAVKAYKDLMEKGETSFAAPTSHIRDSMRKVAADEATVASGALKELGTMAKPPASAVQNLANEFQNEWKVMYAGTADAAKAKVIYKNLVKDLKGATEWEHWAANRDILTREAAAAPAGTLRRGIYESAVQKFDSEFRAAGTAVSEETFNKYAAAVTQKNLAESLVESTGEKLGQEAGRGNPLHLNQTDGGALGIGTLLGNPAGAVGIVAARKITGYVQDKLEPIIAEYAARSAIGARAGAATVNVGDRISGALRTFMRGGAKAAVNARAVSKSEETGAGKLSYTMKAYAKAMETADHFTSEAHQAKVREYMDDLTQAGHPELANQMGMAYGRAVADINKNRPKGTLRDKAPGSLGRTPKQMGLDTQTMKFMRRLHSMRDPVGTIVDGLEKGNLSRDAISSIKYVMPDLHADLVSRAAQEAMALRQDGKFLPADKLALLGVALDHPVDSKLSAEFIGEIQQGLAANSKPQGQPQGGPPPVTDTSSYQTPLQSSV
jgi:hypothetical protein